MSSMSEEGEQPYHVYYKKCRLSGRASTRGGGTWMWDYMSDVTSEPSWIPLALERGTAVLTTDGSYNRRRGPNVSGAGWVINVGDWAIYSRNHFLSSQAMLALTEGNFWAWGQFTPWLFMHAGFINPQQSQGRSSATASWHYTNQARRVTEGLDLG
jgi:hypothetical protein